MSNGRRRKPNTDWSTLPSDLIEKIAGTLDEIADRIRFSAVCTQWRRSATQSRNLLPRVRLPWLLLQDIDDDELRSFFSLSDDKVHTLFLPQTRNKRLVCSSFGWLLTVDHHNVVSLTNPITNSKVSLSPLNVSIDLGLDFGFRCKVLSRPDDAVVVMLSSRSGMIYVHDLAGWTAVYVKDPNNRIGRANDFAYYKDRCFVLGEREGATWIVNSKTNRVTSVIPSVSNDLQFPRRRYLVESSTRDNLYLVISPSRNRRRRFQVFKLDRNEELWCKTRSIGGDLLFVDDRQAMALPAKNFSGLRGNCIAFVDSGGRSPPYPWATITRFGLFDIWSGGVKKLPWGERIRGFENQGWFVPSL